VIGVKALGVGVLEGGGFAFGMRGERGDGCGRGCDIHYLGRERRCGV